jgi:hypothetical protein
MAARVSKWWSGARFIPALRSNAVQRYRLSSLCGLRFVRGGSRVGVCCPRCCNAGGVGRVVRAAHGADLNRECWGEWWRSVALCSFAYHLECSVQSVRVVWCAFRSARAVVWLVAFRVCHLLSFGGGSVGRVVRVTPGAVWPVCCHACHLENALQSDGFVEVAFKGARAVVRLGGLWAFVSAAGCRIRVGVGEW